MKTIKLLNDHELIDNKVGDYDLICPTAGNVGFVPVLTANLITRCRGCDKPLKEGKE